MIRVLVCTRSKKEIAMTEKIVSYPEIPNIPENPEKVKIYGYDPDRDAAYAEMEQESYEKNPFLIPGYIYKDRKMIPIPRIKKRIDSKLYDTTKSECVCTIDGGFLFRKRTRDREWFAVLDDGTVRPLDVYDPFDMALMETGHIPAGSTDESVSSTVMIRVDRTTHAIIAQKAKADGVSLTEELRRLIKP